MGVFDHWHPVLLSRDLQKRPVCVRLHGKDIALFRTADGQVGALDDCCPHRRMRLSMGTVVDDRLQCLYHGWTFNCAGEGESPGTPKLRACASRFETVERHGAIWVKPPHARAEFPHFNVDGHYHLCTLYHRIKAPLETTLDNFTEIEHTPTTHAFFGYPLERMHEVQVRFETTDTSVRVINSGPSKAINPVLRLLLGIGRDYEFKDDWTTYFSPVYSVYDHWWANPHTGREGLVRWRLYMFLSPIDENEIALMTFGFTKSAYPGPYGAARIFRWWMVPMLNKEINLDVRILENLADKSPSIEGLKLSRFDKVLGLNRERIERVYRGRRLAAVA